jgi:hypothetical protein
MDHIAEKRVIPGEIVTRSIASQTRYVQSGTAVQHAHAADRFAREILAILKCHTRACGG